MSTLDYAWDTPETGIVFWRLTESTSLKAFLRHYPAPVYEAEHVEPLLRLFCLIADIFTDEVNWAQLTDAILSWTCERGYDVVEEPGRLA